MDVKAFRKSPTGKIIRTTRGYDAYMPNDLPPALPHFDMRFIQLLSEADRSIGELAGLGRTIPNPDFLVIPYTRLEAVTSSRIEGTQASLSELFYFEAAPEATSPDSDVREVANYLEALNYGLQRLETLPLSLRLVRELHERLMSNVRGGTSDKTPGDFRRSQNWIGGAGFRLEDATFIPPPPENLLDLLGAWETFLHDRESLPPLIQCALMHYQFEVIHPFLDGNGRVGRLLITLFLYERGILPQPLLYLSAYFDRFRNDYYDSLISVSRDGDWIRWLQFFLSGVIVQSKRAIESAKHILDQRERYRQQLQQSKASASVIALADLAFINPYLTIQWVVSKLDITFNTASKAISQLIKLGILEEITGQRRNRLFVARQLLQLIEENEPTFRHETENE